MKVADLIVRCLEAEGVRHVFGVSGKETDELLFSLAESAIRFVPCRHEQGAAFIADVWGRLTEKAGVCLSTLGPGATNLMTGVADATLDKAPLVAITAQGGLDRLHHDSHQRLDIVGMMAPITKWNSTIYDPRVAHEIVRKAFKIAELEKAGATHIELPEDIARLEVPPGTQPLPPRSVPRPEADHGVVEATLALLRGAAKPIVIAGNGAIRESASQESSRLAEQQGIPVVATFMGKGAISDRSSLSLFCIGTGFKDYVRAAIDQADLVLTIGYDIAEYAPDRWNPAGTKKIVHIDVAPAEIYGRYEAAVEMVGDITTSIRALNDCLIRAPLRIETDWHAPIRRRIVADIATYELRDGSFTIPVALNVIRRVLPDDGLLISDVGSPKSGSHGTSRPTARTAASPATALPPWASRSPAASPRRWPNPVAPSSPPWATGASSRMHKSWRPRSASASASPLSSSMTTTTGSSRRSRKCRTGAQRARGSAIRISRPMRGVSTSRHIAPRQAARCNRRWRRRSARASCGLSKSLSIPPSTESLPKSWSASGAREAQPKTAPTASQGREEVDPCGAPPIPDGRASRRPW
jgi:acetolactate synthase I/II/III large subunit